MNILAGFFFLYKQFLNEVITGVFGYKSVVLTENIVCYKFENYNEI